jgi:glycosyltransferase involved in cell wall biosynthesis
MPAYNAGGTIEKVFSHIAEKVKQSIKRNVVVNDGSTDDTEEAISQLCDHHSNLVALRHEYNKDYGLMRKHY